MFVADHLQARAPQVVAEVAAMTNAAGDIVEFNAATVGTSEYSLSCHSAQTLIPCQKLKRSILEGKNILLWSRRIGEHKHF